MNNLNHITKPKLHPSTSDSFDINLVINSGAAISPEYLDHKSLNNKRCSKRSCQLCDKHFDGNRSFASTVTKKKYYVPDSSVVKTPCEAKNIVYLFTCSKCSLQYTGYTETTLSTRFRKHKSDVNTENGTYFHQHFKSENHSVSDMKVQIIYHISNTSPMYDNRKEVLKAVEEYYHRTLCAYYPFGLNDKVE